MTARHRTGPLDPAWGTGGPNTRRSNRDLGSRNPPMTGRDGFRTGRTRGACPGEWDDPTWLAVALDPARAAQYDPLRDAPPPTPEELSALRKARRLVEGIKAARARFEEGETARAIRKLDRQLHPRGGGPRPRPPASLAAAIAAVSRETGLAAPDIAAVLAELERRS